MPGNPTDGMEITVLLPANFDYRNGIVPFKGSGLHIKIYEIFEHFGMKRPLFSHKIWIKRKTDSELRRKEYKANSELTWTDGFNDCIVVISSTYFESAEAIKNYSFWSNSEEKYKREILAQQQIWKEKQKRKKERGKIVAKTAELLSRAKRMIIKKKCQQRTESLRAEAQEKIKI